jgi:hypothetical protein
MMAWMRRILTSAAFSMGPDVVWAMVLDLKNEFFLKAIVYAMESLDGDDPYVSVFDGTSCIPSNTKQRMEKGRQRASHVGAIILSRRRVRHSS